jgi:hypothetical protein
MRSVGVLAAVLCFWLLAVASHVHADDDRRSGLHGSSACTFCLSLPSAAPAPAIELTVAASVTAITPATAPLPQIIAEAPSAYLSQGPPAR